MSNVGTANEGLIGSVKVSINLVLADGRIVEHIIAQVPNIPLELKKAMTVTDSLGNVSLAEEFYDQGSEMMVSLFQQSLEDLHTLVSLGSVMIN